VVKRLVAPTVSKFVMEPEARLRGGVRVGLALDDLGVIVAEMRALHPQGAEDPRARELAQRLPADAFDDLAEECVAGVGVEELLAGAEVQLLLARHDLEHVVVGDEVQRVAPSGQPQQVQLVAEAARVVDEMPQGDGNAEVGQLREVLTDVVVQGQLPVLREQEDRGGRELLRYRGHVERRRGRDAHVVVEVGQAVAPLVDDPPLPDHGQGAARRVGLVDLREELVDGGGANPFGLDRFPRGGRASRRHQQGGGPAPSTRAPATLACCPHEQAAFRSGSSKLADEMGTAQR
jgi:hypothetical protein